MGNLNVDQVAASQNNKYLTINNATDQLDLAMTERTLFAVTSSNARTLTNAEFRRQHYFVFDEDGGDPATAAITITVPALERGLFTVLNDTAFTVTVTITSQPKTAPVVAAGEVALLVCDGINVVRPAASTILASQFTSLTDTPSSYTNFSGQILTVNDAENALAFIKTVTKLPVRAATTTNGTLATAFENGDTIDGVTLSTGDRILLKNQSTGSENGIYVVNATGAPTRAGDFDDNVDVSGGVIIPVLEGTVNANTLWSLTNTGTVTIGSTSLTFQYSQMEIGTWTPVVTFATPGDLSITYSTQNGRYIRIGPLVHVWAEVTMSAFTHTTASGGLLVTGLPFTARATYRNGGVVRHSGVGRTGYHGLVPEVSSGGTQVIFLLVTANTTATAAAPAVATDTASGTPVNLQAFHAAYSI